MRCRICDQPLGYAGRGAHPEAHRECRDLGNDLARVRRSLESALRDPARRRAIRSHVVSETWAMINELTKEAIPRGGKRRTVSERLDAVIASLARTRPGRAALASRGIVIDGETGIAREE